MRLFVAIDIDEDNKSFLWERAKQLKNMGFRGSFPRKENYHITLKFLGEVEERLIPEIKEALKKAAAETAPFELSLSERGVFPGYKQPRVVWIGIKEETGALKKLFSSVEDELSRLGFERERRPFSPHLTLARIKSITPQGKKSLLEFCSKKDYVGKVRVDRFVLYRSILDSRGAIYKKIAEFQLKE